MTRIKLCGLRTVKDARAANAAAPDYVGLVFAPASKRCIIAQQARQIRAALDDSIRVVGVFVDEPVDNVVANLMLGLVDVVQLHGHEDEAYLARLREKIAESIPGRATEIWQAFVVNTADGVVRVRASSADVVLLDGGRGEGHELEQSFLDTLVGEMTEHPDAGHRTHTRRWILAGGLTPETLSAACARHGPWGVDVSSGTRRTE